MRAMLAAALQFDVRAGALEHNLAEVERGLAEAARAGAALVVLPEVWPTSFPQGSRSQAELADLCAQSERALAQLCAWSRAHALVVCGSALAPGPRGELPRNRLHVVDAGELRASYDKVHLFSPTLEPRHFSAGELPPPVVSTRAGRVCALVCYDLRFAEVAACAARGAADWLLVPAQWPSPRAAHWSALLCGRAVEQQCFALGCNRTGRARTSPRRELEFPGNSLIADPHGRVLAQGTGEPGLVLAEADLGEVRRARARVPVARDRRADLYARWIEPS